MGNMVRGAINVRMGRHTLEPICCSLFARGLPFPSVWQSQEGLQREALTLGGVQDFICRLFVILEAFYCGGLVVARSM